MSSIRYRATIAYVGTDFHGWQAQANAARTVQAVLQSALGELAGAPVRLEGASRTDAGVHADGQVGHFDLGGAREPGRIRGALNRRLPADVRVRDVVSADPAFHARFDAVEKEYVYRWSREPVVPPRDAPFVAPLSPRARAELMREAAEGLVGRRDFRIFAVRSPSDVDSVRTLRALEIEEDGPELRARFRGDGFLRGMVRAICGVLAEASRGRVPTDRARELLALGDRARRSPKAMARGLTLAGVRYAETAAAGGPGPEREA